jgi:hypothetical protein
LLATIVFASDYGCPHPGMPLEPQSIPSKP